jgi:hypothetical protein
MAWDIAGVFIHPESNGFKEQRDAVWAIQQPIGTAYNVKDFVGAGNRKFTVSGILAEDENSGNGRSTLDERHRTGDLVGLNGPEGSIADCRILALSFSRVQALNQTLPVYNIEITLIESSES